jgi:hypothetical protein
MLQWGLVAVCRFKCGCVERRNILDWLLKSTDSMNAGSDKRCSGL